MNAVRALSWIPPSSCTRIAEGTQNLLSNWASAWGVSVPGPVECVPVRALTVETDGFCDLLAAPSSSWRRAVAQSLLGAAVSESSVIDGVVLRVLESLQSPLKAAFLPADNDQDVAGPLGHSGVRVTVEVLGRPCGFALTVPQLRAKAWLTPATLPKLASVNLDRALSDSPVPLVAELGHAGIGVDELMQLAPGDVLLLNEKLDTPLRVVSPGSELQLLAHLGAFSRPPRRAARWVAS